MKPSSDSVYAEARGVVGVGRARPRRSGDLRRARGCRGLRVEPLLLHVCRFPIHTPSC